MSAFRLVSPSIIACDDVWTRGTRGMPVILGVFGRLGVDRLPAVVDGIWVLLTGRFIYEGTAAELEAAIAFPVELAIGFRPEGGETEIFSRPSFDMALPGGPATMHSLSGLPVEAEGWHELVFLVEGEERATYSIEAHLLPESPKERLTEGHGMLMGVEQGLHFTGAHRW